jgi:hypothetical protein
MLEPAEVQLGRCEDYCESLRELARIHLEIDPPNRRIRAGEPDWTLRLRKVCHHSVAIARWEVCGDTVHVMATEIRAAYMQIDAVWKCLPDRFRLDEMDSSWWKNEARDELLATFDHPTPFSLAFPLARGGFGDVDAPESYLRLALWLGRLGLGYALALTHLAEVLGAEGDVAARVAAVLSSASKEPS